MGQSADNIAKNRPRVLIFSLAYFPLVGGAEIAVKEITDRLGDVFSFDLITLQFERSHASHEVMGNVHVYRLGGTKLMYPLRAVLFGRKLHRQREYKISWPIMAAYAGWAGLFFKFLYPKVPMLLTLQEGDSESHILKRVGVFYPLWRLIFKKADYIQAISSYLADFARRHGAVCPVEIIPNGVDIEKYDADLRINADAADGGYDKNQQSATSACNPRHQHHVIITTSRLVYKNGIDILLRAVAQLPNYLITRLLIVGSGPDRAKLEKLAQDLDIADKVKFVGHVDPALIPQYLAQADVFIRPSRSEGLGNSFLEAMAAGLPIIGTAVGGILDFLVSYDADDADSMLMMRIADCPNGLFTKVDDPEDLARRILELLGNEAVRKQLGQNGRELVLAKYNWVGIANKMGDLFQRLIT